MITTNNNHSCDSLEQILKPINDPRWARSTRLELDAETRELVSQDCAEDIVRRRTHDV
jgi:hypothetical protein